MPASANVFIKAGGSESKYHFYFFVNEFYNLFLYLDPLLLFNGITTISVIIIFAF